MNATPNTRESRKPVIIGYLLILAGLLYLGLTTGDPTNPSLVGIVLSLPVLLAGVLSLLRLRPWTVGNIGLYAAVLPIAWAILAVFSTLRFGTFSNVPGLVCSVAAFVLNSKFEKELGSRHYGLMH